MSNFGFIATKCYVISIYQLSLCMIVARDEVNH